MGIYIHLSIRTVERVTYRVCRRDRVRAEMMECV